MVKTKKLVLIVEDDTFLAGIYQTTFERAGFKVYLVFNGQEALDWLNGNCPQLVLLDLILPRVNGLTVLKKIRQNPKLISLPVMVLTNLSDNNVKAKAQKLGAAAFLIKAHVKPSLVVKEARCLLN